MKRYRTIICASLCAFVFLALAGLPGISGAAQKETKPAANAALIGTTYGPALMKGYEDLGGGILADEQRRLTDHAIQYVRKGKSEMIWLNRVVGKDPSGKPLFRIVDVLKLPRRDRGEIVTWFACFYKGRRTDAIIAYTDKYYNRVYRAWWVNRETDRIEEVSAKGIVCQDPAATQ
ncbi:MAG TPA: hypothetical protein PKM41_06075 [Deltaproteobacteria bacterium]|nr:hypothetical protein [Deltaproteobacteria bacterium]HOI07582.1 hypothetical protein [Deltaproteobacteria bacterium]